MCFFRFWSKKCSARVFTTWKLLSKNYNICTSNIRWKEIRLKMIHWKIQYASMPNSSEVGHTFLDYVCTSHTYRYSSVYHLISSRICSRIVSRFSCAHICPLTFNSNDIIIFAHAGWGNICDILLHWHSLNNFNLISKVQEISSIGTKWQLYLYRTWETSEL